MEFTDVKIYKTKKRGPVLAYANVILSDSFIIRGITLLESEKNGRWISMPSRLLINKDNKNKDNKEEHHFRDVCHPLNNDVRTELTELVFAAYDEFMKNEEK